MTRKAVRSLIQVTFLLAVFLSVAASPPTSSFNCWSCICWWISGSDHDEKKSEDVQRDYLLQSGEKHVLERYHDIDASDFTLNSKDLGFIREWLPGNAYMGLQIPTAPGAVQPGVLADDNHKLSLHFGAQWDRYQVPLTTRSDVAAQIANVLPPDPGTHWQALGPANDDYLADIPTETTLFQDIGGYLYYALDFHGANLCNGCVVKLVFCTPTESLPVRSTSSHPLLRAALNRLHWNSDECLTCTDPIPTVIRITDYQGNPLPSAPAAWLSPWGGPVLTSQYGPDVRLEYALGHTLESAKTFNLEPIESEKGWTYAWCDLDDNPITQMEVPADSEPWTVNLRVLGTIPPNAQGFDTIHLTATCVSDPSLKAQATSYIGGFPDPSQGNAADVGITKEASAQTIEAGESVRFTLTVTNYENEPVHVVITDTLSPSWAISNVTLPQGCERNGGQIVCQVWNVPAGGSKVKQYNVHTVSSWGATLSNLSEVQPRNGFDLRLYDNQAGPLEVVIEGESGLLFLPLVAKP